jgi:hypothetical protein
MTEGRTSEVPGYGYGAPDTAHSAELVVRDSYEALSEEAIRASNARPYASGSSHPRCRQATAPEEPKAGERKQAWCGQRRRVAQEPLPSLVTGPGLPVPAPSALTLLLLLSPPTVLRISPGVGSEQPTLLLPLRVSRLLQLSLCRQG